MLIAQAKFSNGMDNVVTHLHVPSCSEPDLPSHLICGPRPAAKNHPQSDLTDTISNNRVLFFYEIALYECVRKTLESRSCSLCEFVHKPFHDSNYVIGTVSIPSYMVSVPVTFINRSCLPGGTSTPHGVYIVEDSTSSGSKIRIFNIRG